MAVDSRFRGNDGPSRENDGFLIYAATGLSCIQPRDPGELRDEHDAASRYTLPRPSRRMTIAVAYRAT